VAVGFTELGKMIRRKRKSLKLTQEQLAARARIDKHYLSRIEKGKQQPSLNFLDKIAQAFESKLLIDIPLKQKTEEEQAMDELVSTLEGKSADYIRKVIKAIKAIDS
jgi:transcriptional regulator with XRE-family HTH domain